MRMGMLLWLLLSAPLALAKSCDFDCTLKRHLDALQAKDFDAFEATLTKGKRLSFILPNGQYIASAQEYKRMLKDWFAKGGWTLSYEVIAVEKSADMGNALLKVDYREADRNGQPYQLDHYLSLLFKRDNDAWYLVHDQNTRIDVVAEKASDDKARQ